MSAGPGQSTPRHDTWTGPLRRQLLSGKLQSSSWTWPVSMACGIHAVAPGGLPGATRHVISPMDDNTREPATRDALNQGSQGAMAILSGVARVNKRKRVAWAKHRKARKKAEQKAKAPQQLPTRR